MIDNRLKAVLDKALGETGIATGQGEDVRYHCPFCHHHKRKFEVNLDTTSPAFGRYGCWVCKHQYDSTGTKLLSLLDKIRSNPQHIQELKSLLQSKKLAKFDHIYDGESKPDVIVNSLPIEFFSLSKPRNTPDYRNALHYVQTKRGCSMGDIIRYNIGYCEKGEYRGKVIIPSYDEEGTLNFFTGRNFYESKYNRHKNPNWTKDIIGFGLFVNWNLPIVLVEGAFDAVAVKRNVIPLFGKTISAELQRKILQEKVTDIYLALDADAIRDLIPIAEMFMGYGINTYIVKMSGDKDPNALGFNEFSKILNNTKKATFLDLIQYKMRF